MRAPLIVAAILIGTALSAAKADELAVVPNSTKRICQLTGDFDRAAGIRTLSQTGKRFGVVATDLGSSFEHKGKLYFLFGDTWGRPGDRDSMAWTKSTDPEKIVLDFATASDGKWLPLSVPGISQGAFEIPSGGISIDGVIYVAFTTDHSKEKTMGRSVLARSDDDGRTFKRLYELSRDRFINVSFWIADGWLYIFGSGDYRKSSVCLARIKPAEIGDRSKLRFFSAVDAQGQPRWSEKESEAAPLFRHEVVGEFSVAWIEPVKQFVMLYNSHKPRGIMMRSATSPWGPWSDTSTIFDPWRDKAYGKFMHAPAKTPGEGDTLSDPKREQEWGGEYGPYIMARFTTGSAGRCRIFYTLSTWNPYQVVVMQSELKLQARPNKR